MPNEGPITGELRRFLDAEAKCPLQGNGIRPTERVPFKIVKPTKQVRYVVQDLVIGFRVQMD